MGAKMGTTIKQICKKSRKKPRQKIRAMLTVRKPQAPPGNWVRTCATRSSPPIPRNTSPKAVAPMRIRNTMLVSLVVSVMAARNLSRLSWRCNAAKTRAPKAPTAADSVGEATPKKMEPNTPTTKTKGGSSVTQTFLSRFSSGSGDSAGAASGLAQA